MYDKEFDILKTKALKYVIYKKRTEYEVKTKFSEYDENLVEQVIEFLKENDYINDELYVQKYISEAVKLKNMSYKEISYKLYSKGINLDYLNRYYDYLKQYEMDSANNICIKKMLSMNKEQIIEYLRKKGYKSDSINQAINSNFN